MNLKVGRVFPPNVLCSIRLARIYVSLLSFVVMALFCGCQTVRTQSAHQGNSTNSIVAATNLISESVVKHFPEKKPTVCQKLNPLFWFGNIDDPVPPDDYRPTNKVRTFLWHCRNPMHNFFFYVIGIADREFEIVGRFPGKVSNPNGGWNWTMCRYGCLRLPFVSYKRGDFNFYAGWRNHGNFGIKLNFPHGD